MRKGWDFMLLNDFDYKLPPALVAKYPSERRGDSRLMVVHMACGRVSHRRFGDIASYLRPGDCLVLNDSKVLPARLRGFKEAGGAKAELLLVRRLEGDVWEAMAKPGKRLRPGDWLVFDGGRGAGDGLSAGAGEPLRAEMLASGAGGVRTVRFQRRADFMQALHTAGEMPIPPYIGRGEEAIDRTRYQTVYSREWGSVAAPTAGLHFTEGMLDSIRAKGVSVAKLTLHVGPGTFLPVKCEDIERHRMHFEEYEVPAECAEAVNACKAGGGRVVCVGSTSVRTLESASFRDSATGRAMVAPGAGRTDIFIRPGYAFKVADDMLTNFHLPRSTLLMLVCALYDRERLLQAYEAAVEEGYRFFSYGDAMLLTGRAP
jgi:S-adenosylmethionine:tRNA ribosyltransferase-isomerase